MSNRIKLISFFLILCVSSANFELIELNEDNWRLMLQGEWMVEFFAPWCPACKSLAPVWKLLATADASSRVKIAHVDVTKSPSLSGRFLVTALPTIYHVKNGQFRQYRGPRDRESFSLFVTMEHWRNVEPVSAFKNPDSIHMSILSYFFKLSHLLKDFNSSLQQEYGLPTWGSYALLATATIFVGAALGLVLVCIVDFLYPAKKAPRQSISLSDEKAGNTVDDEIVDDDEEGSISSEEESSESAVLLNDAKTNSGSESEKENKQDNAEPDSDLIKKSQPKSSPSEVRRRNPKQTN